MSFPLIVAAHDAICEKGDEWLFHGMTEKKDPKGKSDTITENVTKSDIICCVILCIILLVGIGYGIYDLIAP